MAMLRRPSRSSGAVRATVRERRSASSTWFYAGHGLVVDGLRTVAARSLLALVGGGVGFVALRGGLGLRGAALARGGLGRGRLRSQLAPPALFAGHVSLAGRDRLGISDSPRVVLGVSVEDVVGDDGGLAAAALLHRGVELAFLRGQPALLGPGQPRIAVGAVAVGGRLL